jgi:hypothetical protein
MPKTNTYVLVVRHVHWIDPYENFICRDHLCLWKDSRHGFVSDL